MKTKEYEHLYALKDEDTGRWLLTYWASSQKHKALFSSIDKAKEAVNRIEGNIKIVEL